MVDGVQVLEGVEVGGDVFTDGGVGAAACFDGGDAWSGEGVVGGKKFGVFAGKR